jgi:hypothetical protein
MKTGTSNLVRNAEKKVYKGFMLINKMTEDIKECGKLKNRVCRMPDCRLLKRVFIYRPRGKRHLGNR